MKKRVVVLIDGENFRYSLKSLFPARFNYLPKKVNWFELFSLPLSEDHDLIRIYWYVVDSLHFRPYEIPDSDKGLEGILKKVVSTKLELKRNEARKEDYLKEKREQPKRTRSAIRNRFSEWSKIQDMIAHAYDYLEFRRCGSITYNLLRNFFQWHQNRADWNARHRQPSCILRPDWPRRS